MVKANPGHKPLVLDILCDSFKENPSVNYVIKQDGKRLDRIRSLMSYSFDVCNLFGAIYLSEDEKACALTLYPEKKKAGVNTLLLDANLAFSAIGINRIGKVMKRESTIKKQYPPGPQLYLWFIGVSPKDQGKGIGSRLMKDLIRKSIAEQRPIYLETSVSKNVIFYERLQFKTYSELEFGHRLFLMRREPD